MNAKVLVPRTAGRIFFYPTGRGGGGSPSRDVIEVGTANVSIVPMKAGRLDPGWAKGRPIFRKGHQFWSNVAKRHYLIALNLGIIITSL